MDTVHLLGFLFVDFYLNAQNIDRLNLNFENFMYLSQHDFVIIVENVWPLVISKRIARM